MRSLIAKLTPSKKTRMSETNSKRILAHNVFQKSVSLLAGAALLFVVFVSLGFFGASPVQTAQSYEKIIVGEIERIDPVNGSILIAIFDQNEYRRYPQDSVFILLNENGDVLDRLTPEKGFTLFVKEGMLYLKGPAPRLGYALHAGQQVGLETPRVVRSELPDQMMGRELRSPYYQGKFNTNRMILVDSGPFVFGSDIAGTNHYTTPVETFRTRTQSEMGKKRVRYIEQKSFYIDIYEVTMGQFQEYLLESGTQPPPGWNPSQPDLPVSNASYAQADSYCQWAGKRLPTELEWEKAARGSGLEVSYTTNEQKVYIERLSIYPVGLEFDESKCVTLDTSAGLQPVYALQDRSPYGIYGACGNAPEWTSSWFLPYRGNTLKNPEYGRKYKVIRGGGYNLPSRWAKSYERMTGGIPSLLNDYRAGFRCAMDVN